MCQSLSFVLIYGEENTTIFFESESLFSSFSCTMHENTAVTGVRIRGGRHGLWPHALATTNWCSLFIYWTKSLNLQSYFVQLFHLSSSVFFERVGGRYAELVLI